MALLRMLESHMKTLKKYNNMSDYTKVLAEEHLLLENKTDEIKNEIRNMKKKKAMLRRMLEWEKLEIEAEEILNKYQYLLDNLERKKKIERSKKREISKEKPDDRNVKNIESKENSKKHKRRKKPRKMPDVSRIKDEVFNIISINARGIASKQKSIEEILKNENIDIAIVSELGGKNVPTFTGYKPFIKLGGHMHGIAIFVRKSLAKQTLRIHDESDLEIVHIRLSSTVPALNIIGTYLPVESRKPVEEINRLWNLYTEKVQQVLDRGEALVCIGDFNRPLQAKKLTHGTKLFNEWLLTENMILVNDRNVNTRTDPGRGTASVLDLALVSANIKETVCDFLVDSQRKMTAFKMFKKKDNSIEKKYTDHFSIKLKLKIPMKIAKKGKKKKIIDFKNKDGWAKYPDISDKYAIKIVDAVENTADPDLLEEKLDSIDNDIQVEAFGVIYVKERDRPKKIKRKSSKNLNKLYEEHLNEVDKAITECLARKDVNSRMYKLKTLINGPKIKAQEQAAINDPKTNVLITDEDKIKEVSLAHNVEILTKMKPLPQYEHIVKEKKESHDRMMKRNLEEDNWNLDINFYSKVIKRIKDKNKNMFKLFNKAGAVYKAAVFTLMKRFIEKEEVPEAYDYTSLTQIWKKKGSALSLNNMRFIHMKCWRAKLLEALITEKMKPQIVEATPNIQIGGMPQSQSVEHLVTLKTWMKQIEENDSEGVVSFYDMAKFFDKESLLDCMDTLNKKANIDAKSYRMLYKLNANTKISVKTSVGESKTAPVKDSIGQGSFSAALASSLNIGCGVADKLKDDYTANIGLLELIALILQDDISKMCNTLEQARNGSQKIDELLKQKLLSVNYDKSKYLLLGNTKAKNRMRKELKKWPMKMGEEIILNSILEKYLGDIIHEKGCAESITATIKERMRKLTPQCEDIIQIANTPLMGGLRNSKIAFKLFESLVIQPLLHNCASWIGITEKHIQELQKFQNKFIRRVLHLPHSITHAILDYDVKMWHMDWRIKERKLNFVRQILLKSDENICKQTLIQEMETGINGLAHECNNVCRDIDIPEIMENNVMSKKQIKEAIQEKISSQNKEKMLSFRKVADRVSEDSSDNNYLDRMGLTHSRIWIRYRARAIKGVKANHKRSWKDNLECRFCDEKILETQEHLEECGGLFWERRGVNMDTVGGKIKFFKRLEKKLE